MDKTFTLKNSNTKSKPATGPSQTTIDKILAFAAGTAMVKTSAGHFEIAKN